MINLPTPGQEKIVSVTTAKASVEPNSRPKTVTKGMEIRRSTCRRRIVKSVSPAARANFTVSDSMISRVPARDRRISMASLNRLRLSAGSAMKRSPSQVRNDHPTPNTSIVGPRSPAGSQSRLTAKVRIRISPTQKVGTENPKTDTAMMALETGLSGR